MGGWMDENRELIHRPINLGEWQQVPLLGIEGFIVSFNQSGKIIEIHQADGNCCPIQLIPRLAGFRITGFPVISSFQRGARMIYGSGIYLFRLGSSAFRSD